ncbi:hypothetical protein AMTRI_Chr01g105460 [Amborella trichopoda]
MGSHARGVGTIHMDNERRTPELQKFMYRGSLSTSTPELLMNLMVIVDKFDVVSCIHQCSLLLNNLPMTPACASLYLEFPYKTLDAVQLLIDVVKQYLAKHQCEFFKDIFSLSCILS